jgi:hypothetical protein
VPGVPQLQPSVAARFNAVTFELFKLTFTFDVPVDAEDSCLSLPLPQAPKKKAETENKTKIDPIIFLVMRCPRKISLLLQV